MPDSICKTKALTPSRAPGLDLVRCVALLFVPAVHFFFYSGYYTTPLGGGTLFLATTLRWLFYSCVPLFLLLSGYLLGRKEPNRAYYAKALRIVFEYLIAGTLCILVRILVVGETFTPRQILGLFLHFEAAPYGWYLALYFGLFLLAPFVNVAYRGLKTRLQKKLLIGTLLLLTALPAFINGIVNVFPSFWLDCWPLTYYLLGCYFAEYRPKLPKVPTLCAILLLAVFGAGLSFYGAHGGPFPPNIPQGYGALPTVVLSSLLFLLLYQVSPPRALEKPLAVISECSLSAYMLSWIFDARLYALLTAQFPTLVERLPWLFVVPPVVFLCAVIAALPLRFAWRRISAKLPSAPL